MILILQDEMLGLNAIYDGIVKKTFCLKLPQYFMVSCTIKQKASLCRLQGIKSVCVYIYIYNLFKLLALFSFCSSLASVCSLDIQCSVY